MRPVEFARRQFYRVVHITGDGGWQRMPRWYIRWRLAKQLGGWNSPARQAIRAEIAKVGGRVLEVACGPGLEYEGLRRAGMKVDYVGVDVTPSMVEIARSRHPGGSFFVSDVANLPFRERSFDTVFAKDLFEHLPGFEYGLREMYRVASRLVLVHFFLRLADGESVHARHPESGFLTNRYSMRDVLSFACALGAAEVSVTTVGVGDRLGDLLRITKPPASPPL